MSDPLFSVAGQVVLVSGASRGIGKAIAQGFAERGAKVVITGRELATLEETAGELSQGAQHPVVPMVCDVADVNAARELADKVEQACGPIDTLVNVAGVNRRKPALEFSEEDYDFVLDINLKGPFFLSQAVGKRMVERGQGSQLNIASLNNWAPLRNVLPYAVSKAGMGHMTRTLAVEWGPHGVRVNALAPGFILTDLTKQLWARQDMQDWGMPNTPLRRLGVPADMIGTAIFLSSPAAAFLTGQIIFVDGGFSAGLNWPI